ncbi:MAG TPA: hypothetical protein VJ183_17350 [Chloroflexia bacterium]|nr:hypothetical protein [Chloroflexia bacterium]
MGTSPFSLPTRKLSLLISTILVLLALPSAYSPHANTPTSAQAQGEKVLFQETGKTVGGRFLDYWNKSGGLARHGYPISEEMSQVSAIDGKAYTVQYFERSVFELHPENKPPFNVLLQLLGVLRYKQKYPGGAPDQNPNHEPGALKFAETGKTLGGIFLEYWTNNGGLASNGYPITDLFQEVSDLDGQPYMVQYFERAVFEYHPANKPPYNVLLSQLGTFHLRQATHTGMSEWKVWDPMDPAAPALMEQGEKGYHLKQSWPVASIEFSYQWSGMGPWTLSHQKVERRESEYTRDGVTVPTELVHAFLRSLDHLYPSNGTAGRRAWTDDDPSWTIEITGDDGNHVLVTSYSTGNPGHAPWNVLYNGRFYTQYDGSLAWPIDRLFPVFEDNPEAGYYPNGEDAHAVIFGKGSYLPQLGYGFWGLHPFSDDFRYEADSEHRTIHGKVWNPNSTGEFGEIKQVNSVELQVGGEKLACNIKRDDPVTKWWTYKEFSCTLGKVTIGEVYRYPITIRLATDTGREVKLTGELWGTWGVDRNYLHLPPSAELSGPLSRNDDINNLLADHILLQAFYRGDIISNEPLEGKFSGEMTFLGKTDIAGMPLRYTVGTRFIIEGGEFKYWTLNRTALRNLLTQVKSLPLTRRLSKIDSSLIINLWYAGSPPSSLSGTFESNTGQYNAKVNPCGDIPGGIFPSEEHPLQAFNYNQSNLDDPYFNFYGEGFMLINDKPVVSKLSLSPSRDEDPVRKALVPREFDTGNAPSFDRVWIDTNPNYRSKSLTNGETELLLEVYPIVSDARPVYERIASSLPGAYSPDGYTLPGGWETTMTMLTFAVQENGELKVVGCRK